MKLKYLIGWGTAVFLMLVIVGCQDGPEANLVTYQSENLGIEIGHPEGWVIDEPGVELILASDTAVINSDTYDNAGAAILFMEPRQRVGDDLVVFLENQVAVNAADAVVEAPQALRIDDRDAATMMSASPLGDLDVFFGTTVIENGDDVLFVLTVHDSAVDETIAPVLDAMLRSVTFMP